MCSCAIFILIPFESTFSTAIFYIYIFVCIYLSIYLFLSIYLILGMFIYIFLVNRLRCENMKKKPDLSLHKMHSFTVNISLFSIFIGILYNLCQLLAFRNMNSTCHITYGHLHTNRQAWRFRICLYFGFMFYYILFLSLSFLFCFFLM